MPVSSTTQSRAWLGEFALLSALWGSSFLFMRLGAAEFGALPTAGLRVAMAALFLLPVLLLKGEWPALRQYWRVVLPAGLLNSAIPFSLFAWAVVHVPTGLASILNATVPLFGALVAWLWLGERINLLRCIGLALGFLGVALLAWYAPTEVEGGAAASSIWAIGACLLAAVFYAVAASYARRYLLGIPALATAAGSQCGAALGLMVPTVLYWPANMPGVRAWAAVLALAVLCTGIAYILYFRIIARAGPSRALAVTFLAPVFAVFYGAVLLGETVTPWTLGCGVVIVCGTLLSTGLVPWQQAHRSGS